MAAARAWATTVQIPVGPSDATGANGSGTQSFQSPITATPAAFGAHTPKRIDRASPGIVHEQRLRAEEFPESSMGALTEEVQIELTDRSGDVGHHRPG